MTGYGPRDAASVLMACGRKVALRPAQHGERAERVRMTDGTVRAMAWLVDGQPVSRSQLEYAAARAESARRAESLLIKTPQGRTS